MLPLPDLGTPTPLLADSGLTRVHVVALVTVAFVVAIGAELLSTSDWRPDAQPSQLELVTDALIGLSFLLVGIVVWDSRPGMQVGLLMYATGLAFFIGNLSSSSVPLLRHLSGSRLPACGSWASACSSSPIPVTGSSTAWTGCSRSSPSHGSCSPASGS